jgi:SAM-dependent methyltransferase
LQTDLEDDGARYAALLCRASKTARTLVSRTNGRPLAGRASFIYARSAELAEIDVDVEAANGADAESIAFVALDMLETHWDAVLDGITGEELLRGHPEVWDQLMVDWPMGAYASIAADYLATLELPTNATVLEVGSGVGAVIRKRPDLQLGEYRRSDFNPFVMPRDLPGSLARYDFNEPGSWTGLDCVFGVNALHCAAAPLTTLGHLRNMIKPGGRLVLVEGANPTTKAGTPWALNHLFGLFDGWWDIGGFRTLSVWQDDLERAGFVSIGTQHYRAGAHHLGGLVWGIVPHRDEGT